MPFLAALYFFTHLNGRATPRRERERESGERQKPPTCEDKALDSCDNDGDKEEKEEQETELILELRLEVKERAGIQPLLWIRLTFP